MQKFTVNFDKDSQNKCIRLARVSSTRQEKFGHSKDIIQNNKLQEYENELHLKLFTQPFEFTESAAYKPEKNRNKFNEMMLFRKKNEGKFKHIIAYKVSRWTRNSGDEALAEELCSKYGYILHFVSEGIVLDKERVDFHSQMNQFNDAANKAKKDVNDLRSYNQDDRELCIKEGIRIGPAPFGYKWEGRGKERKLIIDEQKASVVKLIFELYSTGIYGYTAIAEKVKERYPFIKLKRSKIGKIVSDTFYIGRCTTKFIGKDVSYKHKHPLIELPFLHFQKAQEVRLSADKKTSRNASKKTFDVIYQGLIECSYCKGRITPDRKQKIFNDHTWRWVCYGCKSSKKKDGHPKREYIAESDINKYVEQKISEISYPKEFLDPILSKVNYKSIELNKKLKEDKLRLEIEMTKNRNALKSIYSDYRVEQSITQEMYLEIKKDIEEKLIELQRAYENIPTIDEWSIVSVDKAFKLLSLAPKLFASSKNEEKRLLLKIIFSKLELDGKKPVFTLRKPFCELVKLKKCPSILVY